MENKPGKPPAQGTAKKPDVAPSSSTRPPDLHHSQGVEVSEVLAAAEKDRGEAVAPSRSSEPAPLPPAPLVVDHDASSPVCQDVARAMYQAYLANSGGLAWDGRPCPTWEELNHAVRSHWCAASREAFRRISKLTACDVSLESR